MLSMERILLLIAEDLVTQVLELNYWYGHSHRLNSSPARKSLIIIMSIITIPTIHRIDHHSRGPSGMASLSCIDHSHA